MILKDRNKLKLEETYIIKVEVKLEQLKQLELDSQVQGCWIFWEIFSKKRLKYRQSIGSDAIALNFLKKLDFTDCFIRVLEKLGL